MVEGNENLDKHSIGQHLLTNIWKWRRLQGLNDNILILFLIKHDLCCQKKKIKMIIYYIENKDNVAEKKLFQEDRMNIALFIICI